MSSKCIIMSLILILAACPRRKEKEPAPPTIEYGNALQNTGIGKYDTGPYLMEIVYEEATVAHLDTNLTWIVIDSTKTRKVLKGTWKDE